MNGSSTAPGDYVYFGAPVNLNNRQVNGTAFDKTRIRHQLGGCIPVPHPDILYDVRQSAGRWNQPVGRVDSEALQLSETARRYFELRGEMFNVPNHPVFAAPNTTANNSQFGQITATVNRFRTLQVSARLVF